MGAKANCGYADAKPGVGRKLLAYHGPNLKVSIGLDPTWTADQNRAPTPDRTDLMALVDTGAQECCIDSRLAQELGLPIINKRAVGGVGALEVDVFNAQLHVVQLRYTVYGKSGFAAIPDLEKRVHFPILLGRSFLADCFVTYDGTTGAATIEVKDEN